MKITGVRGAKLQAVQPLPDVAARQAKATRQPQGMLPEQPRPEETTPEGMLDAVEDVNKILQYMNDRLEFSVHEATNRIMVRVWDRQTDEIIREIPPEQFLDLVAKLQELVGLLVDKRA